MNGNLIVRDSSGNGEQPGVQQKAQHLGGSSALNDPQLARLIEVWPMLTEDLKQAIFRLARVVGDDSLDVDDVTVATK